MRRHVVIEKRLNATAQRLNGSNPHSFRSLVLLLASQGSFGLLHEALASHRVIFLAPDRKKQDAMQLSTPSGQSWTSLDRSSHQSRTTHIPMFGPWFGPSQQVRRIPSEGQLCPLYTPSAVERRAASSPNATFRPTSLMGRLWATISGCNESHQPPPIQAAVKQLIYLVAFVLGLAHPNKSDASRRRGSCARYTPHQQSSVALPVLQMPHFDQRASWDAFGRPFLAAGPQSGCRREGQPMCLLGGGGSGTKEK